jgi:hypothetical protein
MLGIPDHQLQPILVELCVSLSARLVIAVLEGSCVDEPLVERDDLCADKILVGLFLVELAELVLTDLVENAAFTTA